jgi:hypothetical protein
METIRFNQYVLRKLVTLNQHPQVSNSRRDNTLCISKHAFLLYC